MSGDLRPLVHAARDALRNAYAPYSKVRVGAAVRSAAGATYTGCNVENVSFSSSACAERNAIAAAVCAEGPGFELEAIAVVALTGDGQSIPLSPCGACRQVIAEFGDAAQVVTEGASGEVRSLAIAELLPHPVAYAPSPGREMP